MLQNFWWMTILIEQIILSRIFSSEMFEQFYQTCLKYLFSTLKKYYYNYLFIFNFLKFICRNLSEYILQEILFQSLYYKKKSHLIQCASIFFGNYLRNVLTISEWIFYKVLLHFISVRVLDLTTWWLSEPITDSFRHI